MKPKTYVIASIKSYLAIQFSGLILGGIVVSLIWAPGAIFVGAFFTFVPTLIYAAVLPVVIISIQSRTTSRSLVFTATSLLTAIFFVITAGLIGALAGAEKGLAAALFLCSFPPGWIGTHVAMKQIARQSYPPVFIEALKKTMSTGLNEK
jgi:hypothetical protein